MIKFITMFQIVNWRQGGGDLCHISLLPAAHLVVGFILNTGNWDICDYAFCINYISEPNILVKYDPKTFIPTTQSRLIINFAP